MSLYTKYRPRDWDSVVGQDAISTVLRTSLIQDRVGHAYILTGSRGTGKTTTARILAKGVNCLDLQNGNPCHKCTHCIAFDEGNMLDCIEIDGASNNGVENVRDLIEKARFEPNQGKFKIYIIDEVHMLSTGAFNALLKTLEEPPAHVKFILATTEIDKVPETIRSRSLRFDFKKITEADIVKRLEYVCSEEHIQAEPEALQIIARAARGALRDALTLTEQNTVNGEISTEYVRSTLSLIEDSLIAEIIQAIVSAEKSQMITILDTLRTRHAEVRGLFDQILYALRDRMMSSFLGKNKADTPRFAEYSEIFAIFESAYSRMKSIPDGWLLIEITLLRAVARGEKNEMKDERGKIQNRNKELGKNDENSEMGVRGEGTVQKFSPKGKFSSDDENSESMSKANTGASLSTPDAFGTFGTKSTEAIVGGEKGILSEDGRKKETEEVKTFGTFSRKGTENDMEDPETSSLGQKHKKLQRPPEQDLSSSTDTGLTRDNKTPESKTFPSPFSYIRLLEEIKKTKATLVLDLKTARFELKDTLLTLIFSKEWHYNRTNTPSTKSLICENLSAIYSGNWTVDCKIEGSTGSTIADEVF